MKFMSTQTLGYYDTISQLPEDTIVIWHSVTWEEYEALLERVGEASGLRLSFDNGTLQAMTLSPEHEKYVRFIERLVSTLSLRLRIKTLSFGSATLKKRQKGKGSEPDACFYVQTAAALGKRIQLDFAVDPPPDIAVEVDVHHDSHSKLPIYLALGVPEIWRYDGRQMTVLRLESEAYVEIEASPALPMLTGRILTEYLTRMREEGEFEAVLAFDHWLQSLPHQ
jgi:Uma2 family endonuclease